jgi:DNA-binding NtrC family response regulator
MKTLVLTGWGWTEYAAAAAAALDALGGDADVRGMSKRRLPEFMESEASAWKRIVLVGLSLGGDEMRLAQALRALKGKTKVVWISALPMSESQAKSIAPLLKVVECEGGPFNGSLVKAVGTAFGTDVSRFLPFAAEGAKAPKSVAAYQELLSAAMFAYRSYQDGEAYSRAIEALARGVPEDRWDQSLVRLVAHYRRYGHRELVGKSGAMKELRGYIDKIAAHPEARVLIVGESGTGKETVAQQIHAKSPRRNEPFIAFNCASVNPALLESRFFGHVKGAFTGADRAEPGLFELAEGGTLFLDEIGELPPDAQGILLRVLEGGRFMRVGGREEIKANVRLVTATNRILPRMVREGKFREDLFMRLNVVQVRVPPLREHKEDIDDIADHWWFGRFRKHLAPAQLAALKEYDYPGNVRELMNLLERAAVLGESDFARLVARHREMNAGLDEDEAAAPAAVPDLLDNAIREHVRRVLRKYALNVTRAASALGISRTTLRKWI